MHVSYMHMLKLLLIVITSKGKQMALTEREFNYIITKFHGDEMNKKLREHRKSNNSAIIGDVVFFNRRYELVTGVKTTETSITEKWESITQIVTTTNGTYIRVLGIPRENKEGKK